MKIGCMAVIISRTVVPMQYGSTDSISDKTHESRTKSELVIDNRTA